MINYYITPPRKKQYARAERRQNGGVKRGFDRVFFLANREEKQGENRREPSVANAPKKSKRAVFRAVRPKNAFGILHSFEAGFLFRMPFCGTDAERNRHGDRSTARACARTCEKESCIDAQAQKATAGAVVLGAGSHNREPEPIKSAPKGARSLCFTLSKKEITRSFDSFSAFFI